MNNYEKNKERARQKAITWQARFADNNYSWGELADFYSYFYRIGKRYGLLTEFKAEGII